MDPVAFGQAMMHAWERGLPLFETFVRRTGEALASQNFDPLNVQPAYFEFMKKLASDPEKFIEIQEGFWNKWVHLWQESAKKMMGEQGKTIIEPEKSDRRFRDAEWQENAVFDFIKQSYLLTCRWLEDTVHKSDLDKAKKDKLALSARLLTEALSPSNFLMTNPEVLRETIKTGGENLVKGLSNLIEDLERGKGDLHISITDYEAFKVGKNIAVTPGKVVFQNSLMQLIQYEPTTDKVFRRPLLIVPPWINKYYILDLKPENSLVRWLVAQGHTVFMISWVNPGPEFAEKSFSDYMQEGTLESLKQIRALTGEPDCNVAGYCLGGTLMAITMAWLAAQGRGSEIASATFLATLLDFRDSGDLRLFMDDEQLAAMDRDMSEKGVLEARKLQKTFSLLRSSDLIWSFVINNYLMGREPFPFDLLYWNDDSTNMPAAMHSFYLRKMYRDNLLAKPGGLNINGSSIDLGAVKTPAWFVSTREDHIAPWKATFAGTRLLGGPVEFTLSASGHVAGIINPPDKKKYCFWTSEKTDGASDSWLKGAHQHDGSWWPQWQAWIQDFTGGEVEAREVGNGIEAAPGRYVRMKS